MNQTASYVSNHSQQNMRFVDADEIRTGQFLTVAIVTSAFVLDYWPLIAFQFAVFTTGFLTRYKLDLYVLIYRYLVLPARILKQDMRIDNIEAYHFANIMGMFVSGAASYFLYSGQIQIGWTIVLVMMVLGSLGFAGWCIGCYVYYQLQKMGIKGFFKHPPLANTFPGFRGPRSKF